jgi:hypothetical protein
MTGVDAGREYRARTRQPVEVWRLYVSTFETKAVGTMITCGDKQDIRWLRIYYRLIEAGLH